jgi:ligand-binding sensor domain-containing protein/serine phosphatase RsbU (regulator of sigma subunit)
MAKRGPVRVHYSVIKLPDFKKAVCIWLPVFILAFTVKAQTFNFKNYSVDDGLSQSQVLAVFQSRSGLFWFGTNSGGVSAYDGHSFTSFTGKDGLVNNVVYSICEDAAGNILFGTNGGLSIYNGFCFRNYSDAVSLPHKRIFKIVCDRKNQIWIATARGVCRYDGKKISRFLDNDFLAKNPVFEIYADSRNNIWFGTLNGIYKYDGSHVEHFSEESGLDNNFIRTIIEDKDGSIWAGSNKAQSLNHYQSGRWSHKGSILPNASQIGFTASACDKVGNIWFASASGAFKYDGKKFTRYYEHNGLGTTSLFAVTCDREGNMWFGTSGAGVSKLSNETFFNLGVADSLPRDYITAIFKDSGRNMWVGVQGSGVVRINEGLHVTATYCPDLNKITQTKSVAGTIIQCMLEDDRGRLWFGTNNGLSVFDGKTFQNYSSTDGLTDNKIYFIARGTKGRTWIGTKSGLCFHDSSCGDHSKTPFAASFPEINNLLDKDNRGIPSICVTKSGAVWFASEKGVFCLRNGEIKMFDARNHFTDRKVSAILEDDSGALWFGTDEGLFLLKGSTFVKVDENAGLCSNKIYLLIFDTQGRLWIGTNKGLDRLQSALLRDSGRIELKHYGKDDGFMGLECNSNACSKDAEGRLWFGTIKGVTVYDPRLEKLNRIEPLTTVSKLRLFFQDADFSPWSKGLDPQSKLPQNLVLPYTKNHLTFDFRGISLSIPSKVRYTFRLEGIDADWVPATSKNEATYSSLPSGEYTFQLKACNNDGLWNARPFTYHFTVLPPWYKTWWFYSLCLLLTGSGVYLFIQIRTQQLLKTQLLLERQVKVRTRELIREKEKVEVINKEISSQKSIIEARNRDITDSIRYAKNIQEAILPQLEAISQEFPQSFILYMPKDIVSGDFYWFAKRRNKIFIAAADCTGHGVPGAFMSIIGNTLLNEIVSDKEILEPGEILNELHAGIKNALRQSNSDGEQRDGMDIVICAMEIGSAELEYAGANRALWIFREGKSEGLEVIRPDKFPIGGLETETKRSFSNKRITLKKGDIIYLSTDGYADQFGGVLGKKMMVRNFQKKLSEILHLPFNEQKEILQKHFASWKGEQEQVDDVLVIGFKF